MTKDPTYCFLINCASNAFRAEAFFKERETELATLFHGAEFIYIGKDDSIEEIARLKAQTFSHIIACGGDGTVNRTANGLIGSTATLGVIPIGSGNDFAQNIGLDCSFSQAIEVLKKNQVVPIDAIKTEWGYFVNTFGIGVDGLTNYYSSQSHFKSGTSRYFWGGLKALVMSRPFKLDLTISENSSPIKKEVWMIAVANGKTEGGKYTISPDSVNHDGVVEIVVVKKVSRVRLVIEFLKLSFGYSFKDGVIDKYTTQMGCSIKSDRNLRAHADGEQVAGFSSWNFKVITGALPVVIHS